MPLQVELISMHKMLIAFRYLRFIYHQECCLVYLNPVTLPKLINGIFALQLKRLQVCNLASGSF